MLPLIDTHQHLIYPDHFSYDWTGGIDALKGRSFELEAYEKLVGENVSATIFMETAVDEANYRRESEFALGLAGRSDTKMAGVVAAAFPENEAEFDEWLEVTGSNPLISGYRRVLHVVDDEMSKGQHFRDNVKKIGDVGKAFDMCFLESQLGIAVELAAHCDNTQLVLDHCGVPNIAGGDLSFWREQITKLAKMDHVACKISGLVAYCGPDQDHAAAVAPYIEHVIEAFGWDRCVWGGDWPVVNMAMHLPDWVGITKAILAKDSIDNLQKLFSSNAKTIYGLNLV